METARTIIEKRVAGIGVSEPQVRTEVGGDGSQRIVAEVPGVDDPEQVRRLVGSTGRLEFLDPRGQQLTEGQDVTQLIEDGTVGVLFDGGEIDIASVTPAVDGNIIGVQFSLSDSADQTCASSRRPTSSAPDRSRSTARSSPRRRSARSAGARRSSRSARRPRRTRPSAELYNTLRFGALPISLTEQGVETVDPTLGADFLDPGADRRRGGPDARPDLHDRVLPTCSASWRRSRSCSTRSWCTPSSVIRRHPDPRRRRRIHPQHRHGGRREHPHLRAHEGGDPGRQDCSARRSRPASTARGRASSTPTSRACSSPAGCTGRGRRSSRDSRSSSSSVCSSACSAPSPSPARCCGV